VGGFFFKKKPNFPKKMEKWGWEKNPWGGLGLGDFGGGGGRVWPVNGPFFLKTPGGPGGQKNVWQKKKPRCGAQKACV